MTFENAGSSKMRQCVLSFLGIGIILAIFHVMGSNPSVNDWLVSLRKRCLVASGYFLIIDHLLEQYPSSDVVHLLTQIG